MSATYEPVAIAPPDLESLIAAHLRAVSIRPGTIYGRTVPTLPVTISGTVYTAAVVVRDDGGTWPNRSLSVDVIGARDASYVTTRELAVWVVSKLSLLAEQGLPVSAVMAVRGPMGVVNNPPEFQVTTDLSLVG